MHAIVADVIINVVYVQVDVMGLRVYRVMLIFLFLSDANSVVYYLDNHRLFTMNVTGSPSSKYEHRRAWALLRNIQNIRICMGKKPIVSLTYENERISTKNSLPYSKCVLRLSCGVHGQIYGRFMWAIFSLYKGNPIKTNKTAINRPVDHTGGT